MNAPEIRESFHENEKGEKFGPFYKIVRVGKDGIENWITPYEFETKEAAEEWLKKRGAGQAERPVMPDIMAKPYNK